MKKISSIALFLLAISLLACGCMSFEYKGPSYSPTTEVKILKKEALPEKYSVMGNAMVSAPYEGYSRDEMQRKLLDKARSNGADAVVITCYEILPEGTARIDQIRKQAIANVSPHDSSADNFAAQDAQFELQKNLRKGNPSQSQATYERVLRAEFIKFD